MIVEICYIQAPAVHVATAGWLLFMYGVDQRSSGPLWIMMDEVECPASSGQEPQTALITALPRVLCNGRIATA
jgi:hypothetical protein